MKILLNGTSDSQEESHWLSAADLMAGLMMVFLFIAIALMLNAFVERDQIKRVAVAYQENQVAIYDALVNEFNEDLTRWNADIDQESLTFTFKSPDVLFQTGEEDLNDQYKELLTDFFPRYVEVLEPFRQSINEVRIEGHTSSAWNNVTEKEAYFNNMNLSQGRTRSVLEFAFDIPESIQHQAWIKSTVAAVGLSSSKLIFDENGNEDNAGSRRVSFRVITNADIQIKRILEGQE
jgi:outer membrane protein OmpA-like peptidoglycan-associated protein